MTSENWSGCFEVVVTRTVETVYVVNAKDEAMAEQKARAAEDGLTSQPWSKRTEELTVEASRIS